MPNSGLAEGFVSVQLVGKFFSIRFCDFGQFALDKEPEREIVADEAADKPAPGEHLVQPRDVFLDKMCGLGDDQKQEHDLASGFRVLHQPQIIVGLIVGNGTLTDRACWLL